MACKIEINDKVYSDILGQVKDPVIAMRLYLQDSSDNMIAKAVLPAEKKVLNLIDSRLKKIDEKVQSKEGNKFVLKDEKNRLETIKKQLKEELKEGNTLYFYTTAKDYLAEIEKAVEGDITEDQLKSYYTAVKMMEDFNSNFSNLEQELPSDTEISLKAKLLALKLEPLMLKAVLDYTKKAGFTLEEDDLKYLKETGGLAAQTLDLSSDSNEFLQYVNKVIKEASALRDFKLQEELQKIVELENGLSIEDKQKIFKKGKNGKVLRNKLITKHSDEFFKDYYGQLNEINQLREDEDWLNFKAKRREHLNWMSTNTAQVNPQYFITTDETKKRKLFEELSAEVGGDENAQELIDSAQGKWDNYQKTFADYREYINNLEDKTDEQKKELIRNFQVENSPDIYFGVLFGDRDAYIKQYDIHPRDHFDSRYISFAPKASITKYYSDEYKALEENKKLFAYYKHLRDTMNKYKNFLPEYSRKTAYRNDYIYRSKANMIEIFNKSGLKGVAPKITEKMINAFTTTFEHEYAGEIDSQGASIGSIPVSKLISIDDEIEKIENILAKKELTEAERKNLEKRLEELETQYNVDPSISMEQFLAMSLNYKFMSEVANPVELASDIINSAKSVLTNGTVGNPVNTKARFNHHINSLLYGKTKDVEMQYSAGEDFKDNIFKAQDLLNVTSTTKKRAQELSKSILAMKPEVETLVLKQDSGVDLTDEELSKTKEYKSLIGEYRGLNGRRLTGSAALDTLIQYTSLKTFGLSGLSGATNLFFGVISAQNEASSGEFFNNKDFRKAFGIVLDSTKKYMSLGNVNTAMSTKTTALMDKFGIVSDVEEVRYSKNKYKQSKAENLLDPYQYLKTSDFFISALSTVSAMNSTNKRFVTDINGNKVAIWDAFDKDGKWKSELFDPDTNFAWSGDVLEGGSKELANYGSYLKELKKFQHGAFDRGSVVLGKKTILGRLLFQYKSWLPEYMNQRFGSQTHNAILNTTREGRYRTVKRLLSENEDLGTTLISRIIKLTLKSNQEGLTEAEVGNIRKTKNDLIWYITITMLMILLKSYADDDDDGKVDKGRGAAKFIINSLHNLQSDIGFAWSPSVFQSLTSKVIPSISVYSDLQKSLSASYKYIFNSDEYTDDKDDKEFAKLWRSWAKNIPFARQIVTTENRAEKLLEDQQKN